MKFAFATAILKIETLRMRRRFARVFSQSFSYSNHWSRGTKTLGTRLCLRRFLSIVLRIPTAHDFRIISAGKQWVHAHNERNFPQAKLDSEIDPRFLLNEHWPYIFYCIIIVYILSSLIKKITELSEWKKDRGGRVHKTVTLWCKLWPWKQWPYERFTSTSF